MSARRSGSPRTGRAARGVMSTLCTSPLVSTGLDRQLRIDGQPEQRSLAKRIEAARHRRAVSVATFDANNNLARARYASAPADLGAC
jgi:hypothetical protein